jgi:hypothetical protein
VVELGVELRSCSGRSLAREVYSCWLPPTNNDLKTYDVGNLHVCTEGTAPATVGYLEVEYVVDLMTPQIQDPVGGSQSFTSDVTHIFKTVNVTDNDAVFPFTTSGGQTMTFYQNWEGLMILNIVGTVASSLSCAATGTVGSAVAIALGAIANSGATAVQTAYSVRALPGTILTWTPTATTVTSASLLWATAAYAGLDFTLGSSAFATPINSSSVSSTTLNAPLMTSNGYAKLATVSEGGEGVPALTQSMIEQVVALRNKKH